MLCLWKRDNWRVCGGRRQDTLYGMLGEGIGEVETLSENTSKTHRNGCRDEFGENETYKSCESKLRSMTVSVAYMNVNCCHR